MAKFIIGKKRNMTQLFTENGKAVPVTIIEADLCVITQVKNLEKDGYAAVQVGYGKRKEKNITKPQRGHMKTLGQFAHFKEFRIAEGSEYTVGDTLNVEQFVVGDKVRAAGTSKGKGFQGVVRRHGFGGSPASHGHKDQLRMPGSIGAGGPQRVFKGTRMGGQMGNTKHTTVNLEVMQVDAARKTVSIKGAVPGARNSYVALFV